MTIFNPADPVHKAANAYRGAVKSAFNEAYGLKDSAPNPAKGNEVQIKQASMQHMRTALANNHDKNDEIHNTASDFLAVQKTPSTFLDWQRKENRLLIAVENGMIEAGTPLV